MSEVIQENLSDRRRPGLRAIVGRRLERVLRAGLVWGLPGVVAGVATIFFIVQLPYAYQLLVPESLESVRTSVALSGGPLPEAFLGVCVLLGAILAGYREGVRPALSGTLCGVVAASTEQAIAGLGFPPFYPTELAGYTLVALPCGWLGGRLGGRLAERSTASQKAQYAALRFMARAKDADAVAFALSKAFSGASPVGIGVWRMAPGGSAGPNGIWQANPARPFDPAALLLVSGLSPSPTARTVGCKELPEEARKEWQRQGVGSIFTAPLLRAGGSEEHSGQLLLAFGDKGRARRLTLVPSTRRRVMALAAGTAMALERWESARRGGVMQERVRWARDVHDSIIQCLAGVVRELQAAERAERLGFAETAGEGREAAKQAAKRAIAEARSLIHGMRPETLDESSFSSTLSTIAARTLAGSGIRIECVARGEVRPLPDGVQVALARISQEALQNVLKHSQASRATVALLHHPDRVFLEVTDDGVGVDSLNLTVDDETITDRDGGFGLGSMRGRAEELGGVLRLHAVKEGGTKLVVEIPTDDTRIPIARATFSEDKSVGR